MMAVVLVYTTVNYRGVFVSQILEDRSLLVRLEKITTRAIKLTWILESSWNKSRLSPHCQAVEKGKVGPSVIIEGNESERLVMEELIIPPGAC